MAITSEDHAALADLAMQALDTVLEDYGEQADLVAASLIFEVRVGEDSEALYHVNYRSLPQNSPHHIAGLCAGLAQHLVTPEG